MPAEAAVPPEGFGADRDPAWRADASVDPAFVLSTHAAHRIVLAVRRAWPAVYPYEDFSGRALANKLGEGQRSVQKRLAGTQPMTLADVMTLAALFGDAVLDALPRQGGQLFPADYDRLLAQWAPGAGVLPRFADPGGGWIDWGRSLRELASYCATAREADRHHLLTAQTYRYELALTLQAQGVALQHLENTGARIERSACMTLYDNPPTVIVVSDMCRLESRATASMTLMGILYQTAACSQAERVLILVADALAWSQVEVHLPEVLAGPTTRFTLAFQRAAAAGLASDEPGQLLPDLELEVLAQATDMPDHHITALRVGK
ncbi:hypothetical protein [Mycolicibacterium sp.]|uniref:hypothetical protein n=1 Tax=Mycolicibacterium sp. TaxID=2320850 RepID=UPI0037C9D118